MTIRRQSIPVTAAYYDDEARLIERPDGFYWQRRHGGEEYGPFPTLAEAASDMQYGDDEITPDDLLIDDPESGLGLSDWSEGETGLPGADVVPRLDES